MHLIILINDVMLPSVRIISIWVDHGCIVGSYHIIFNWFKSGMVYEDFKFGLTELYSLNFQFCRLISRFKALLYGTTYFRFTVKSPNFIVIVTFSCISSKNRIRIIWHISGAYIYVGIDYVLNLGIQLVWSTLFW